MPFSGPDDSDLPSNVQELPIDKRRQWVAVFNSTIDDCDDSASECESQAFRNANGVVKEKGMTPIQCPNPKCKKWQEVDFGEKARLSYKCEHCGGSVLAEVRNGKECTHDVAEGEKCDQCYAEPYVPYGGAQSFTEVDAQQDIARAAGMVSDQKYKFDAIFENIWSDTELSADQKRSLMLQAVNDLADRIENPPEEGERSIVDKAKDFFHLGKQPTKTANDEKPRAAVRALGGDSAFYVTKDKDGSPRWWATVTNHFKDRDEETFAGSAHEEFKSYLDQHPSEYPELRLWHIPGSGIGQADFWAYTDGFVISSGKFYSGLEHVASKIASSKETLGISHGYWYKPKDLVDGVYQKYRTREISVLPLEHASNVWTAFSTEGTGLEDVLMLTSEQKAFLADKLGEEKATLLEDTLARMDKQLQEEGISFKQLADKGIFADEKPEEEKPDGSDASAAADNADPAKGEGDAPTGEGSGEGDGSAAVASEKPEEKPDGDGDGADSPAQFDQKAVVKAMQEALAPFVKTVGELQATVADLQRTDDAKTAAKMAPRASDFFGRPSESNGNRIDKDKAEEATGDSSDKPEHPSARYVRQLGIDVNGNTKPPAPGRTEEMEEVANGSD